MIISFTGHRDVDEQVAASTVTEILDRLNLTNPVRAIVGGAVGADTLAAEVCWDLGIPYEMALPHIEYAHHYKLFDSDRWQMTRSRAQFVSYVVGANPFHFSANFKRNEYMVDHSHVLVSISTFDPNGDEIPARGGTAHCVRYARKVGRLIEWARV